MVGYAVTVRGALEVAEAVIAPTLGAKEPLRAATAGLESVQEGMCRSGSPARGGGRGGAASVWRARLTGR